MTLRRLTTIPFGTLIRGGNITVDNTTWPGLWAAWDWDGWIKFQIDELAALGGNCVRLMGGVAGVADGTYSQATYLAHWEQFLDYTASVGIHAYPCGGDFRTEHWGSTTDGQATTLYSAWASLCDGYDHIIGLDVSNEAFASGIAAGLTYAQTLARMTLLSAAVRAATDKPITHSRAFSLVSQWTGSAGGDIAPISDFHDIHVYYDGALPADVSGLADQPWGGLPILIGEFGAYGTGADTGLRTGRYTAIKNIVDSRADVIGALAWAISDTNTSTDFGTSGLVAPDGTVRTDIASVFAAFPAERDVTFPRIVKATIGGAPRVIDLLA